MQRILHLVLVLGALIGLFGQGLAFACVPAPAHAAAMKAAMPDDCMRGVEAAAPAHAGQPCKGLTLACIAAMGCTVPLVVPADPVLLTPGARPAQIHGQGVPARYSGRDLAPEPNPPSVS